MAKSTKSAQKSTKSAQGQSTTGAKVAKAAKRTTASAQAPAKPAKATKSGQQGQSAPRGQFAGKRIRSLVGKGETPCRGGAATRFDAIVRHKNVNDAIGSTYRIEGEKEDRTITSADIAYLVKRELIAVE
jgi:hypothetical protein